MIAELLNLPPSAQIHVIIMETNNDIAGGETLRKGVNMTISPNYRSEHLLNGIPTSQLSIRAPL